MNYTCFTESGREFQKKRCVRKWMKLLWWCEFWMKIMKTKLSWFDLTMLIQHFGLNSRLQTICLCLKIGKLLVENLPKSRQKLAFPARRYRCWNIYQSSGNTLSLFVTATPRPTECRIKSVAPSRPRYCETNRLNVHTAMSEWSLDVDAFRSVKTIKSMLFLFNWKKLW